MLDDKKRVANNLQTRGFCHPFLERRKRGKKKRPEVKKKHPIFTFFGVKNGQEVVLPFWAQKYIFIRC